MRFRTLLPALGFLCLFCSSAQAQTLDDTLLTTTVEYFPTQYYDYINGIYRYTPSAQYSITSLGLPQGSFMNVGGFSTVSYSFDSISTNLAAHSYPTTPGTYEEDFYGYAGPISALGTYPILGSYYLVLDKNNNKYLTGNPNGEITVTTTPEPISGSLAAIGFAMLALRLRLSRNRVRH